MPACLTSQVNWTPVASITWTLGSLIAGRAPSPDMTVVLWGMRCSLAGVAPHMIADLAS
jgi:hypothetical protein